MLQAPLVAAFHLSPEELSEKAQAQARNSEGQFVEEVPVKATLPEPEEATPPPPPPEEEAAPSTPISQLEWLTGDAAGEVLLAAGRDQYQSRRYADEEVPVLTRDGRTFVAVPTERSHARRAVEHAQSQVRSEQRYREDVAGRVADSRAAGTLDEDDAARVLARIDAAIVALQADARDLEAEAATASNEVPADLDQQARDALRFLEAAVAGLPVWAQTHADGRTRSFMVTLDADEVDSLGDRTAAFTQKGAETMWVRPGEMFTRRTWLGDRWTMPTMFQTQGEVTINHELGHMIDTVDWDDEATHDGSADRVDVWKRARDTGRLSEYGETNPSEGYAEAFAAWRSGGNRGPIEQMYAEAFGWDADEPVRAPRTNAMLVDEAALIVEDWAKFNGFDVTDESDPEAGVLRLTGVFDDRETWEFEDAFEIDQTIDGDQVFVERLWIAPRFQEGGRATHLNAILTQHYRDKGVRKITANANADVGAYALARMGFDFDWELTDSPIDIDALRERAESLRGKYAGSEDLDELIDRLEGPMDQRPTPLDFAMVGSDGLDESDPDAPETLMWLGKALLTGHGAPGWYAVKRLRADEEATPPPPPEPEAEEATPPPPAEAEMPAGELLPDDVILHYGLPVTVTDVTTSGGMATVRGTNASGREVVFSLPATETVRLDGPESEGTPLLEPGPIALGGPYGGVVQTLDLEDGFEAEVIDIQGRPVVLVDIGGVKVPFYISTGQGGKADVPTGKWYPIMGIGNGYTGWFNKIYGQEDYYGNDVLRDVAERLDAQLGDKRGDSDVVRTKGRDGDPVVDALNQWFKQDPVNDPSANKVVLENLSDLLQALEEMFPGSNQSDGIHDLLERAAVIRAGSGGDEEAVAFQLQIVEDGILRGRLDWSVEAIAEAEAARAGAEEATPPPPPAGEATPPPPPAEGETIPAEELLPDDVITHNGQAVTVTDVTTSGDTVTVRGTGPDGEEVEFDLPATEAVPLGGPEPEADGVQSFVGAEAKEALDAVEHGGLAGLRRVYTTDGRNFVTVDLPGMGEARALLRLRQTLGWRESAQRRAPDPEKAAGIEQVRAEIAAKEAEIAAMGDVTPEQDAMAREALAYLDKAVAAAPEALGDKSIIVQLKDGMHRVSLDVGGRAMFDGTLEVSTESFHQSTSDDPTLTTSTPFATMGEYAINHNLGHVLDGTRTGGERQHTDAPDLWWRARDGGPDAMSELGRRRVAEGYAEAFTAWIGGDRSPLITEYAQRFGWDGSEPGEVDEPAQAPAVPDEQGRLSLTGQAARDALVAAGYDPKEAEQLSGHRVYTRDGRSFSVTRTPKADALVARDKALAKLRKAQSDALRLGSANSMTLMRREERKYQRAQQAYLDASTEVTPEQERMAHEALDYLETGVGKLSETTGTRNGRQRVFVAVMDPLVAPISFGDNVAGLAHRNGNTMWINPVFFDNALVRGGWWNMPSTSFAKSGERTINHELGHLVDAAGQEEAEVAWAEAKAMGQVWQGGLSQYGQTNPQEGYAEVFSAWQNGERTRLTRMYARRFGWEAEEATPPPPPEEATPPPPEAPRREWARPTFDNKPENALHYGTEERRIWEPNGGGGVLVRGVPEGEWSAAAADLLPGERIEDRTGNEYEVDSVVTQGGRTKVYASPVEVWRRDRRTGEYSWRRGDVGLVDEVDADAPIQLREPLEVVPMGADPDAPRELTGTEAVEALTAAGYSPEQAARLSDHAVFTRDGKTFTVVDTPKSEAKRSLDRAARAMEEARTRAGNSPTRQREYERAKAKHDRAQERYDSAVTWADVGWERQAKRALGYLETAVAKLPKRLGTRNGEDRPFVLVLDQFQHESLRSRKVDAVAYPGGDTIWARPRDAYGGPGEFMGKFSSPFEHTVNHELGHLVEPHDPVQVGQTYHEALGFQIEVPGDPEAGIPPESYPALGSYARSNAHEAYAETFAAWQSGDRSPVVMLYAERFGWDGALDDTDAPSNALSRTLAAPRQPNPRARVASERVFGKRRTDEAEWAVDARYAQYEDGGSAPGAQYTDDSGVVWKMGADDQWRNEAGEASGDQSGIEEAWFNESAGNPTEPGRPYELYLRALRLGQAEIHPHEREKVEQAKQGTPIVPITSEALKGLIRDGRLTQPTPETADERIEAMRQRKALGAPRQVPLDELPTRGWVKFDPGRRVRGTQTPKQPRSLPGTVQVQLRPEHKERMSVTFGDALTGRRKPLWLDELDSATDKQLRAAMGTYVGELLDLQVHGGIGLGDIESITMSARDAREIGPEGLALLRRLGIKVTLRG